MVGGPLDSLERFYFVFQYKTDYVEFIAVFENESRDTKRQKFRFRRAQWALKLQIRCTSSIKYWGRSEDNSLLF